MLTRETGRRRTKTCTSASEAVVNSSNLLHSPIEWLNLRMRFQDQTEYKYNVATYIEVRYAHYASIKLDKLNVNASKILFTRQSSPHD